jgi:hypothetical protein
MVAISSEHDFADLCLRLEQNNKPLMVGFVVLTFNPINHRWLDDSHCIRFGQALMNNTNLKQLRLCFPNAEIFRNRIVTNRGLQALAHGIGHSHLTELDLRGEWRNFAATYFMWCDS